MQSTISIEQLEIICIVGILDHERKFPQKVLMDIDLEMDLNPFLVSRNLEDSADYAEIASFLTKWITEAQFDLLETLAIESCNIVLKKWTQISQCKITVKKPAAIPNAKYASVSIQLKRPHQ